ncbi:hypothetical protein B9Z55_001506 [Caenorhabditis nigoni]|uniref:Uncharacterized protein n=1 Tax=Caenorhabditis nigoni TaxID=1611254 RepID=A0A2G5VG15_9PELO|nr:hypothetical protein B9Z55_001506 [Caenorhabditis nigoni]
MFPNLVRNFLEPGWKKRVSRICLEFSPNLIGNRLPESAKNININSVRDAQIPHFLSSKNLAPILTNSYNTPNQKLSFPILSCLVASLKGKEQPPRWFETTKIQDGIH